MTRADECGHTRLYTDDGSELFLALAEYADVKSAWMAGRAFYEGSGIYGEPVVVKLTKVYAVSEATPEITRLAASDAAEARRLDMLSGEG